MFDPDPNKKSKRPPPLPSFGNSKIQPTKNDNEMQKKLDSFFTQISKQVLSNKQAAQVLQTTKQPEMKPEQKTQKPQAMDTQVSQSSVNQTQPSSAVDKKKLSLASINSKLNSMLSTKKINLNLGASKPVQTLKPSTSLNPQKLPKVQKKRNQLPGQYDPNIPNSYDLSSHFYSQKLKELEQSSDEDQEDLSTKKPQIVNKTGLGMQRLAEDMKSEQEIPQPQQVYPQEEQVLQQKQQVALRMMQKFGYKVGTGLGKQSQGIIAPLTIKKTTDTSCIIEQSSINLSHMIKPQLSAKNALIAHGITPTQVIVFINLIKMSDLTQTVEKQLREECESFGHVKNWIVYLLKDGKEGKEEVRIFVEYQRKQEAFVVFCRLNNRYYREGLASVRFYQAQSFREYRLGLDVHAHVET